MTEVKRMGMDTIEESTLPGRRTASQERGEKNKDRGSITVRTTLPLQYAQISAVLLVMYICIFRPRSHRLFDAVWTGRACLSICRGLYISV